MLRAWGGLDDTIAIQRLASLYWPYGPHPGGLGWSASIGQLADQVVLVEDKGVRGWAGLSNGELTLGIDASRPDLVDVLVTWGVAAGHANLTVPVVEGDDVLRTRLEQLGFSRDPGHGPLRGMFRQVTPERAILPPGYHVRGVEPDDGAARIEVHRAAWSPPALPWAAGMAPELSPGATSALTDAVYESVRSAWLYDASLDLVVEAPDGSLAASCIAWYDADSKCAEIEPLGVVPEHRRRGLAGALCLEVCARCAERDGAVVYINQSPRTEYPAPAGAYLKVGFTVIPRGTFFTQEP